MLLDTEEFALLREDAARHGMTVSDWVRHALHHTRRADAAGSIQDKLLAIEEALDHDHPTADIDRMIEEVERGYHPDSSRTG